MAPLTHAIVLTAGLGTRLQPLTSVRAKPAIPVAGEPVVRRIIRGLASQGVTDLVLNLHHLPPTVTAVVGDGTDLGARVRYSWEQPAVLGTAGGPRQAQPILGADTFFLINGDTLTDLLLSDIRSAHGSSGALVTLALVRNTEPLRYGGVLLGGDGVVRGFVPRGALEPSYHFIGVQVVEAEAFATVVPGSAATSIGGVFDRLIEGRPGSIRGHVCDARFWDIGTIPDYWRTSLAFSDPSDRWPRGSRVSVHPTSAVRRSIVWDDVEVGERSVLDQCILTDGVRVPPGSVYRQSILVRTEDGRTIGTPFGVD